jgi:hypothetical protein
MMKNQKKKSKGTRASKQRLPRGWDEARVRRVIEHYENQTEDEALAEDEAAMKIEGTSVMLVPTELVPETRRFIAKRRGA